MHINVTILGYFLCWQLKLKKYDITIPYRCTYNVPDVFDLPQLCSLKRLEVHVHTEGHQSLLFFTSMDQELVSAKGKLNSSGNGRFDKLPDDVLIGILSHMNVNEVVKMSVLAHRWEHLWKDAKTLRFHLSQAEMENFLACVNVEVKHQKGSIEGMAIVHDFEELDEDYDSSMASAVDRLVRFAVD